MFWTKTPENKVNIAPSPSPGLIMFPRPSSISFQYQPISSCSSLDFSTPPDFPSRPPMMVGGGLALNLEDGDNDVEDRGSGGSGFSRPDSCNVPSSAAGVEECLWDRVRGDGMALPLGYGDGNSTGSEIASSSTAALPPSNSAPPRLPTISMPPCDPCISARCG